MLQQGASVYICTEGKDRGMLWLFVCSAYKTQTTHYALDPICTTAGGKFLQHDCNVNDSKYNVWL